MHKSAAERDDIGVLSQAEVLGSALADVAVLREQNRLNRLRKAGLVLGLMALWIWVRLMRGDPISWGFPQIPPEYWIFLPGLIFFLLLAGVLLIPLLGSGRSPHVVYRPSEIDITLADVKGAGMVVDEVVKTINLFLAFKTFREKLGGTPRRAILFEGPPGTGKTYVAKAMAREAGVPFLFVSSSAFQSMYYGQTNRKIRSFFKTLRKIARREGGALGFIEEIDAIGAARSGLGPASVREGVSGVVNELLIQLQSFDVPSPSDRMKGWFIDYLNRWVPHERQLTKPKPVSANILVIGATNRAADLDPALVRPGRFDRTIHFDLPSRSGRREIIDYYLGKKAHAPELDDPRKRDALAAMTFGYSPVMIEHLFDESLVWALRRGADALSWQDIQQAKMTEEIGLKQPVEYTIHEREVIATHEAGHATVAHLVGIDRRLEVLSIIKRRDALGLLAHRELEERFTKSRSEISALIAIGLGGMVAEELFFSEAGTGAASDLMAVTTLAAQMVGTFGMGGSLVSYEAVDGPVRQNVVAKVLADERGREALEEILQEAKKRVRSLIHSNRDIVAALRDALFDRDELVGDEIVEVIEEAMSSRHLDPHLRGRVGQYQPPAAG